MERVMKLTTGSRKCTPWWIPVLLVFGALALMPNSEASHGQESIRGDKNTNASVANGGEQANEKVTSGGKSQWRNIDIRQLAVDPLPAYRVHAGDVLGITAKDIFGDQTHLPISVLNDGTISLPLLKPISVQGLTVAETRERVQQRYFESKIVAPPCPVLITMIEIHRINVLVWRVDDEKPIQPQRVKLRGNDSDVLHAFSLSGGFPKGPVESISIIRAKNLLDCDLDELPARIRKGDVESELLVYRNEGHLQLDESVSVSLKEGDLLFVLPK
jgi:protein involved in polysaccharide export with SLBB domain